LSGNAVNVAMKESEFDAATPKKQITIEPTEGRLVSAPISSILSAALTMVKSVRTGSTLNRKFVAVSLTD
jgi:hypothetical protein